MGSGPRKPRHTELGEPLPLPPDSGSGPQVHIQGRLRAPPAAQATRTQTCVLMWAKVMSVPAPTLPGPLSFCSSTASLSCGLGPFPWLLPRCHPCQEATCSCRVAPPCPSRDLMSACWLRQHPSPAQPQLAVVPVHVESPWHAPFIYAETLQSPV